VSPRAWIKRCIPAPLRSRWRALRNVLGGPIRKDDVKIAREALRISHSQISGFDLVLVPRRPHRSGQNLTSAFYDRQHQDAAYRTNNWLLDQMDVLKEARCGTIVEIGCGNGRFLRAIAPHAAQVIGVDWAQSPELLDLPPNVSVLHADVVTSAIPAGDLLCSADVLEHFAPGDVDRVVAKLVAAAPHQHHVIACYDDGHTHLSILPPAAWLAVFRRHCPPAYLSAVEYRRNDPTQIVCVVSNLPPR
jgi:SAM-dependent methyltransferase